MMSDSVPLQEWRREAPRPSRCTCCRLQTYIVVGIACVVCAVLTIVSWHRYYKERDLKEVARRNVQSFVCREYWQWMSMNSKQIIPLPSGFTAIADGSRGFLVDSELSRFYFFRYSGQTRSQPAFATNGRITAYLNSNFLVVLNGKEKSWSYEFRGKARNIQVSFMSEEEASTYRVFLGLENSVLEFGDRGQLERETLVENVYMIASLRAKAEVYVQCTTATGNEVYLIDSSGTKSKFEHKLETLQAAGVYTTPRHNLIIVTAQGETEKVVAHYHSKVETSRYSEQCVGDLFHLPSNSIVFALGCYNGTYTVVKHLEDAANVMRVYHEYKKPGNSTILGYSETGGYLHGEKIGERYRMDYVPYELSGAGHSVEIASKRTEMLFVKPSGLTNYLAVIRNEGFLKLLLIQKSIDIDDYIEYCT